jgi:NAD(P)H-dependent flavin oxidoreductase YrpB (nitropropane dioxygenase family)
MEAALPLIIQGGMGIGVSNWRLARAVSLRGHLGVVSGTCIDSVLVRRLQDGLDALDIRAAMERFPLPEVSLRTLKSYFLPNGRPEGTPYKLLPMWREKVSKAREQITMLASFVEVHLAKHDHDGLVGINLLTKVQMPNLATLYGAMLAGVDYVLMGAGIPREIPGVLDAFARGERASMRFDVDGLAAGETRELTFDPADHFDGSPPQLKRPKFLPIVAASSLATMLLRKATGQIDGFVVEGPTAGGHNAPPRGKLAVDETGEPLYGPRDVVDPAEMKALGKPFWMAGGTGSPEAVQQAVEAGAAGVQVGTLFAFCEESGLAPGLKSSALAQVRAGKVDIRTDLRASPTGFPFKVLNLPGTNAIAEQYEQRTRICDLGYLRTAYKREDGRIDYRCPAEPKKDWIRKGGAPEEAEGRKCLCNGLMANIDLPQTREDGLERAVLTTGNELANMKPFLGDRESYSAGDVIDYLTALVGDRRAAPAYASEAPVSAGAAEIAAS